MSSTDDTIGQLRSSLASLKKALDSAKESEQIKQDDLRLIEEAIGSTQQVYNKLLDECFVKPCHEGLPNPILQGRPFIFKKTAK